MSKESLYQPYLPFIPICMGDVQHEWIDLYAYEDAPFPPLSLALPACSDAHAIKINFYPRATNSP